MSQRDVEFTAEDGTVLRGTLHVPPTGHGPAVVMAHGFSGVAEQISHYAAEFAARGLTTLVFDHRGFGRSDGTPRSEVDPWRQLGDWRDAIDVALTFGEVDVSAPVGVWGSSFAGGLAMILAATDPRIGCVVAQIPNVSGQRNGPILFTAAERARLAELVAEDRQRRRQGGDPGTIPVFATSPTEACALPPAVSPRYVEGLTRTFPTWRNEVTLRSVEHMLTFEPSGWIPFVAPTPLLMIVGRHDTCTSPQVQLEVFDSAREPKKLVVHPGGHFDTYDDHFALTVTAAGDWLTEHLRDPAPAQTPSDTTSKESANAHV
jgi:uncharacterized protein